MENPLKVSLENIIPLTEARDHFSQIVNEVQKDKLYVLTKGGKPAVAIVDVKYLEHITGGEAKVENVKEEIKKAPEKVGLPPMVEHSKPVTPNPTPPIQTTPPPPPKPPVAPLTKAESPKPAGFAAPQPPKPSVQNPAPVAIASQTSTPPPSNPVPSKTTPTPSPQGDKIDVQFSQEPPVEDKSKNEDRFKSPDDKTAPSQYDGKEEEPEDMSID
ncbi:MAG: type II toxin-antitoxin system prevent-host-death family antitoxin [Patescibacteria group bacterium]|nr:type II toxin-antitoxin system prevent-host-death family antitoxin [Patescibacteria group bacterium]